MTYIKMKKLTEQIWKQVQLTRDEGQKEYAHDKDNVFSNFERTAKKFNTSKDKAIEREHVLLVFLLKHIDGITAHIDGHKSQREDIRGRIKDAIVYLMLLWGMIEDKDDK